jgi:hypothetical protein
MFAPVVTKDPTAVAAEVHQTYRELFPEADPLFVPRVFAWTAGSFNGNHPDYQPIDARYHDLEHTLQGTLCFARLLLGRFRAGAQPLVSQHMFELGLIAMLMHDTGYLKRRDDTSGTGAKYTIVHVSRSAEFAGTLLAEKGYSPADITSVQNMICCTGVDAMLHLINFQNDVEKVVGYALGTADLLGQMAADDYVDKLPILFSEFAEAARHTRDKTHIVSMFSSAEDLMRKTPNFWEKYVQPKLNRDFESMHKYLNNPFPNGTNWYLQRIEANMACIRMKFPAKK